MQYLDAVYHTTCFSHNTKRRIKPSNNVSHALVPNSLPTWTLTCTPGAAIDANAPLPEDLEPSGAVDSDEEKDSIMAALARHKPRPLATYTHVSQRSKYQYIRMKDMIRSALGAPPGASPFGNAPSATDGMNGGLRLGMMGAPPSATSENFPGSAGMGGFPMSAGLDAGMARRQSGMGMGTGNGPRQILPGQLPGPGGQRKSSLGVGGS